MLPYYLTEESEKLRTLAGLPPLSEKDKLHKLLYEIELHFYLQNNNLDSTLLSEGILDKIKDKVKSKVTNTVNKLLDKKSPKYLESYVKKLVQKLKELTTDEGFKKSLEIINNYKPEDGKTSINNVASYVQRSLNSLNEEEIETDEEGGKANLFKWFRNKEGEPSVLSKNLLYLIIATIIASFTYGSFANIGSPIDTNLSSDTEIGVTTDVGVNQIGNVAVNDTTSDFSGENSSAEYDKVENSIEDMDKLSTLEEPKEDLNISKEDKVITNGEGYAHIPMNKGSSVLGEKGKEHLQSLEIGKKIEISGTISSEGLSSGTANRGDDGSSDLAGDRAKVTFDYLVEIGHNPDDIEIVASQASSAYRGVEVYQELDTDKTPDAEDSKDSEDSKDVKDTPIFKDIEAALKTPRLVYNKSKFYTILTVILPAITDPEQPSKEVLSIIADPNDTDPTLNDNFVNKRVSQLKKLEQTDEVKKAIYILKWTQLVKKEPESIGVFLNKLDSKIDIPWKERKLTRPGEKGKSAFNDTAGRPDNFRGNKGSEPNDNVAEHSLLRILAENSASPSGWTGLPGYSAEKAKKNLGFLVPVYVYLWDLEDNGAIRYVSNENSLYRDSFNDFYEKFANLRSKVAKDLEYLNNKDKEDSDDKNKSGGKQDKDGKTTVKTVDKKTGSIDTKRDVWRIANEVLNNERIMATLRRIDKRNELYGLVRLLLDKLSNLDTEEKLKSVNAIKTRYIPPSTSNREVSENKPASELPDVKRSNKVISSYKYLEPYFSRLSSLEKVIQFFLRVIVPSVDPKIAGNKGVVTGVFRELEKHYEELSNDKTQPSSNQKDTVNSKNLNEQLSSDFEDNKTQGKQLSLNLQEIIGKKGKYRLRNLLK